MDMEANLVVHDEHGNASAVLRLVELLARLKLLGLEARHARLVPQLRRLLLQRAARRLLLQVHAVDAARRQERRELEEELRARNANMYKKHKPKGLHLTKRSKSSSKTSYYCSIVLC